MKLGVAVRTMGPQSRREVLEAAVRDAEAAGLAHVWVQDHLAIPPDDAEGSGGRYLDPLTTLAWLAGRTERIGLGTGVINLPYRPPLPTAKAIATVQELSGGRLHLGIGVGWMKPEFRALGVPRHERGARTDTTLDFLHRAFADDVVRENGQDFLFLPRPTRPPIYVGGHGEHALRRAARFGDAWLPMGGSPEDLSKARARLGELAQEAGRPTPRVACMTGFDPDHPERVPDQLGGLREAGVSELIVGMRYADLDDYRRHLGFLAEHVLSVV
ncbi:MAG: TIGR03619 family F420-dependent LLM class oxidoreductase [Myxococcota bacterium]